MLTQRDFAKITTYLETEFKPQLKAEIMDYLYPKLDLIIGELKAIREDFAATNYRQSIHSDTLENHEERLTVLEQTDAV